MGAMSPFPTGELSKQLKTIYKNAMDYEDEAFSEDDEDLKAEKMPETSEGRISLKGKINFF